MSIRQACRFYDISKSTLQRWLIGPSIKTTWYKTPSRTPNDALLKDVEDYPGAYLYERAERLNCSKSGVGYALKRLNISQKKDIQAPQILLDKKGRISK